MLTRRHIRAKVLQNIYAINKLQSDAIDVQEKFMNKSFLDTKRLYLLMISTLIEIVKMEERYQEIAAKKHLATPEDKNPNKKFIQNRIFQLLLNSEELNQQIQDNCGDFFKLNEHYIKNILDNIKASELYKDYMCNSSSSFDDDKKFIINIYSDFIAPDEGLYDLIEDQKLTWIDDFPVINTKIVQQLSFLSSKATVFGVVRTFKNDEDQDFATQLFRKTILNFNQLVDVFKDKTNNWNIDRVADIDIILMCMSVAELRYFPSIPVKVTINEYIEISKDYSTPKSNVFINGVLNVVIKELNSENKILKTGRGLIE